MTLWRKTLNSYKGTGESFKRYYDAYGGWKGFVCSPYLHLTLVLSLIVWPLWRCGQDHNWYELTLNILPDVLGFTLGGYTILLAFGSERFLRALSETDEPGELSPFMRFNGTFVHFIFVQILAIILAIIGSAWGIKNGLFAWVGLSTLIYSILIALAAVFAIMRLSKMFEAFAERE